MEKGQLTYKPRITIEESHMEKDQLTYKIRITIELNHNDPNRTLLPATLKDWEAKLGPYTMDTLMDTVNDMGVSNQEFDLLVGKLNNLEAEAEASHESEKTESAHFALNDEGRQRALDRALEQAYIWARFDTEKLTTRLTQDQLDQLAIEYFCLESSSELTYNERQALRKQFEQGSMDYFGIDDTSPCQCGDKMQPLYLILEPGQMTDDGQIYCGTCSTAYADGWDTALCHFYNTVKHIPGITLGRDWRRKPHWQVKVYSTESGTP